MSARGGFDPHRLPPVLSSDDVARYLMVDIELVQALVRGGTLSSMEFAGKRIRVWRSEFLRFCREQTELGRGVAS